jgi:hypothetical protein
VWINNGEASGDSNGRRDSIAAILEDIETGLAGEMVGRNHHAPP